MECRYCQAVLPPGVTICPACGHPVPLEGNVAAGLPDAGDETIVSRRAAPSPAPPPRVEVAPAQRPSPQPPRGSRAIFMDFNQAPRDIVRVMQETEQKVAEFRTRRRKWSTLLWLLFPLGLPFVCADVVLGYNICTFSLVALTLWAGAIFGLIFLWRQGQVPAFGPRFDLARGLFDTLKDDVALKRTLVGWLDLTGAQQDSKKIRDKTSPSGRPVFYYRDEWLRLKTNLYDGNVLRLSLVDRVKARQGYWKRSRSGKNKWRGGSQQNEYQLEFSISVDPGQYEIVPSAGPVATIPSSRFVIEQAEFGDGRVTVSAVTPNNQFDAWDVLNALRFGYDHIRAHETAS